MYLLEFMINVHSSPIRNLILIKHTQAYRRFIPYFCKRWSDFVVVICPYHNLTCTRLKSSFDLSYTVLSYFFFSVNRSWVNGKNKLEKKRRGRGEILKCQHHIVVASEKWKKIWIILNIHGEMTGKNEIDQSIQLTLITKINTLALFNGNGQMPVRRSLSS